MRIGRCRLLPALAPLVLAGALLQPAFGQRGAGQGKDRSQNGHPAKPQPPATREPRESRPLHSLPDKNQPRDLPGMIGVPHPWMEYLQGMTPAEQERFLSNNERFTNLPPERQAQIRRRLQQWNNLTPEQRAAVRERQRIWQRMTPEQQRHVRDDILPRWQLFPAHRRQILLMKLRSLRDLNDTERAARLNDESFLSGLSHDEQAMLRELGNLRVGMSPELQQASPPSH